MLIILKLNNLSLINKFLLLIKKKINIFHF
jgi:hypothetical protein